MSVAAAGKAFAPPRFQLAYVSNSTTISGLVLALANSVVVANYFGFVWAALWLIPAAALLLCVVIFGFRKNASAPQRSASFSISADPYAVSTMISVSEFLLRMNLTISKPSGF